ncbi:hypothetical protein HPHPP26_1757 [Helicobacter pylori Hp P-26]|nr:hypothetical protein [Helicobacter pylori]EJC49037.1 hypothetical protein HPHPP26_1757 [Helicobacter pylori Hp P-26]
MMRLNAFNHDQIKPTHPNHQQEIKNKKQNKQIKNKQIKIKQELQS